MNPLAIALLSGALGLAGGWAIAQWQARQSHSDAVQRFRLDKMSSVAQELSDLTAQIILFVSKIPSQYAGRSATDFDSGLKEARKRFGDQGRVVSSGLALYYDFEDQKTIAYGMRDLMGVLGDLETPGGVDRSLIMAMVGVERKTMKTAQAALGLPVKGQEEKHEIHWETGLYEGLLSRVKREKKEGKYDDEPNTYTWITVDGKHEIPK